MNMKLGATVLGIMVLGVGSSALGEDDGPMFGGGVTLPDQTVVYAVMDGGNYALYAVTASLPWPELEENETWAEYLERISTAQGLPSGYLNVGDLAYETHLSQTVEDGGEPAATLDYAICWGTVGGTIVVGRFSEFEFITEAHPSEAGRARIFHASAYPGTEGEAQELMEMLTVQYFPDPPIIKPSWGIPSRIMEISRPGPAEPLRGDQNDGGYQCVLDRNARDTACQRTHSDDHKSCVYHQAGCHLAGATICLIIAKFCPPAGLVCAGVDLIICAKITADCRDDADMIHRSCRQVSNDAYRWCCRGEGVDCGME
ncbi:MAG: hypothetical protein KJ749_15305 [Planctomycetes bacterium]|nr:hypothetical protein [Planctomycetota bacterium]